MSSLPTSSPATAAYRAGLLLLPLSALVFFIPKVGDIAEDSLFGIFVINYIITITYFITLLASGLLKKGTQCRDCILILLILFLISAYALNRTIPVFEESAGWLGILLFAVSALSLTLPYYSRLPRFARQALVGAMGIASVLWLYLTIYLLPLYPISVMALIALGFSLHSFAPLLLLIFTIRWIIGAVKTEGRMVRALSLGVLLALAVPVAFTMQWKSLCNTTTRQYQHTLLDDDTGLPAWIKVSRSLPDNWATERFLKGSLVYSTAEGLDNIGFAGMPSRSLNEVRKHDPLVLIATLFSGGTALLKEERIRILESKYDARHKTEERLWSGANLRTTGVITNAAIWPQLHLAYTEQTITVSNSKSTQRWQRQEEALYTFQLPEGSAVTSLSLWINGKEQKGILTTKGRADSAYKEIVGVEQRDPSVVHWAEGNRISVRVFPVLAGENRVFKIGVTTPLAERNGRMVYSPMRFEGPPPEAALATTQITVNGALKEGKGLNGFEEDEQGRLRKEGAYNETWQMSFKAPPLQEATFAFNGNSYSLQAYRPQRAPVSVERIYLDLNASWTRDEFDAACDGAKGKKLYAYTDNIVAVTEANRNAVFNTTSRFDFSLFPLFRIDDPESALLITKNPERSPNVKDLAGSDFAMKLQAQLSTQKKVRLFNLGTELSPYLKSLKEHRAFCYEHGSVQDLRGLLSKNEFAAFPETGNSIVIDDAGLRITKSPGALPATAPDHLQRLFAYNHLIQQMGKSLYTNMEGDSMLMKEASEAYVVSPLSSLVVLESAADYERFGIKDNGTSLGNAKIKSNGAVPEPHEWALIIVALAILAGLHVRRRGHLFSPVKR